MTKQKQAILSLLNNHDPLSDTPPPPYSAGHITNLLGRERTIQNIKQVRRTLDGMVGHGLISKAATTMMTMVCYTNGAHSYREDGVNVYGPLGSVNVTRLQFKPKDFIDGEYHECTN